MKKTLIFTVISFLLFTSAAYAENDNSLSSASSGSDAQAVIGDVGSHNSYPDGKRYFAPAGEMIYPNIPGRFDAPEERYGYGTKMKISDILEYDEEGLTTREAKKMAKNEALFGGQIRLVRAKYGKVAEEDRMNLDTPMPVVYSKQKDMESLGNITVVSDNKKSISTDVFARAQVLAWELGGAMMHVKGEGWQRELHSKGKGIGFSWTGAKMGGNQAEAVTGVMGIGASWGQAGYFDHPWIIIHVLAPRK